MNWILRLYPREWRRRYGAEVEELVASQPRSLQLVVDLLAGAVDAHLKPQVVAKDLEGATDAERGGMKMFTEMTGCCSTKGVSRKDALIGAGLTLGSALAIAGMMLIGSSTMTRTIGMTMFPGVLVLGTLFMHLRGHSMPAKVALIGGMFLILFLIGLAAALLQSA